MKTFYWYFRPIAVSFKVMCTFPISNVLLMDTSQLEFKSFSLSNMYSSIIFFTSVITLIIIVNAISKVSDQLMFCIMIYVLIGKSLTTFLLLGAHSYKELPKLIRLLDNFDIRKQKILKEGRSHFMKILLFTIIPYIIFSLITILSSCVLCNEFINAIFEKHPKHITKRISSSCLFSIIFNVQVILSLQYIFFARNISFRFQEITIIIKGIPITGEYSNKLCPSYLSNFHLILSEIRLLHNMLNECVSQLGNIYGSFIAMDHTLFIGAFVTNLTVSVVFQNELCLFLLTFHYGLVVLAVLYESERVKDSVSIYSTYY